MVGEAIASVLGQDFQDFELVVSDNSAQGCRDLVERFGDPRIRYVRPDPLLTLVPHWDFAFAQATGDWALLLCDDDALASNCLSTLDRVIRTHDTDLVGWGRATYTDDAFWEPERRNRLALPAFSGRVEVFESAPALEKMFASGIGLGAGIKEIAPHVPCAAWSRRLMQDVRGALGGDAFVWPCPMTSGCLATLALRPNFVHVDFPFTILGHCADSAAAQHINVSTHQTQNRGHQLVLTPVKDLRSFPAMMGEVVLQTQHRLPGLLGRYHLDMAAFYVACEMAVRGAEATGDASAQRQVLDAALAAEPAALQAQVRERLARPVAAVRCRTLSDLVAGVLRRLGLARHSVAVTLDTAQLGLTTISQCAAHMARLAPRNMGA